MNYLLGQSCLLHSILLGLIFMNSGLTVSIQELIQARGSTLTNLIQPSSLTLIASSPPENLGAPGRRDGAGAR